jgi:hypothetical protein
MKARLALKLGILAIVALASLSGCIVLENQATIRFNNNVSNSVTVDLVGADVRIR